MNPNKAEGATDFIEDNISSDIRLIKEYIVSFKVQIEQLNKRVTKLQKELLAHTQVEGCRE